ncbi:MAG: site-specific DNA-methyltransferase, partial [Butyrivibrio sp.]|nr:site-specific DNA-methyltransferase [Butyrivibrio sp.]
MDETKVSQQINDVANDKLKNLQQLFPSVVKDGKVDFDALRSELGQIEEVGPEKFELMWAGKAAAKKVSREDIIGRTLKYIPEDGKNTDTTENLYIEGDNLEVLKLLRQNYYGAIKMIYIDPPYNTGNDFIYNDSFVMSKDEDDKASGVLGDEGERYAINKSSQNRYHANWLNMMYPRLKIARELLTDDGVIFISIDENEVNTLKTICDEIFGADNFIAELIWSAGRKNDSKYISVSHEYILAYFRDMQYIIENKIVWREKKQGLDDIYAKYESLKKEYGTDYKSMEKAMKAWYKGLPDGHPAKDHAHYNKVDEVGVFFASDISWPGGGGPMYNVLHPVTKKPV